MPLQAVAAVLNHLFAQGGWALPRLAPFAGKTARFDIAPFTFAFTIQNDGTLRSAAMDVGADAQCVIAPFLLPRLALHDEKAYTDIASSGDAALLAEIFYLSRHLRWDAAEDLSRATGDIAAERIVLLASAGRKQVREAALNLSQALAEYWTEERPVLAKPGQVDDFVTKVDRLRDDVARLEKRINQLRTP